MNNKIWTTKLKQQNWNTMMKHETKICKFCPNWNNIDEPTCPTMAENSPVDHTEEHLVLIRVEVQQILGRPQFWRLEQKRDKKKKKHMKQMSNYLLNWLFYLTLFTLRFFLCFQLILPQGLQMFVKWCCGLFLKYFLKLCCCFPKLSKLQKQNSTVSWLQTIKNLKRTSGQRKNVKC